MPVSLGRVTDTQSHKRQLLFKRLGIIAGFVLLLTLLVGNALTLRRLLSVQNDNEIWVNHTRQVLFELERTESLLKDAETGQRGFLYTGDSQYLAPYTLAITQIDPNLDILTQLTADNPHQQARIPVLRSLAQERLSQLAHSISLYRSGRLDDAKSFVKSGAGLVTMNNVRSVIAQMEKEEDSLVGSRTATYEKSTLIPITGIYLASLLAAIVLVLLACYILWGLARQEKYLHEIWRREEWYRVTLTCIGDAVIATNQRGNITFLNPVAETLTGTSLAQGIGQDLHQVFPISNEITKQPAENPVQKVLELGRAVSLANHTVLKRSDGVQIPIEDSAAPIRDDQGNLVGVVLVFRDVSLEQNSREVLRRTEKLAAAARLSATIAHEINNPLEAVVNLVYLAKAAPGAPQQLVDVLTLAEQELERVAHITRQTLGFYRESNVPEPVEMPSLIESVLNLYSNKLQKKNIAIERKFLDSSPLLGVAGELRQVVSNLIANAADAVGHDGTITFKTWCEDGPEGKTVHMAIEDDGPGIANKDLDRIFEPFFTTKKDVGTGLGLWVTKEIVERHGGTIQASSRDDGSSGAAFNIVLPCTIEAPVAAATHS